MRSLTILLLVLALLPAFPAAAQTASLVRDIDTEDGSPHAAADLLIVKDKVFFTSDQTLRVTDGTQEGTRSLTEPCHLSGGCFGIPHLLGALDSTVLWADAADSLWRSDGTRQGTVRLDDPEAGFQLLAGGGGVFFGGAFVTWGCTEAGCGPWRTDGTGAGTRLIKNLAVPSERNALGLLHAAGTRIFFELTRPGLDRELWVSDATAEGTRKIAGFPGHDPAGLTVMGDRVFFIASGSTGEELWTSDGTAAGTRTLTNLGPEHPFGSFGPSYVQAAGGRVYFLAGDPAPGGAEFWRSDGTPQGTQRIFAATGDLPVRRISLGSIRPLAGDRILFTVDLETRELWTAGAAPRSAAPLVCAGPCPPVKQDTLETAGQRAVFHTPGLDLWGTDGTAAGTVKLQDHCPAASCPDSPRLLPWPQGTAFFGWDDVHGSEIWITDGTRAGTRRLTDLPGRVLPPGTFFTGGPVTDGRRAALGVDSPAGYGLWMAGASGTRRLAVLARTTGSSLPEELRPFGSGLLFSACVDHGRQIWRTSGSEESTLPLTSGSLGDCSIQPHLTVAGSRAFFLGAFGFLGNDLWRTDGTPQGTFRIASDLVADQSLTAFGGKVYFPVRLVPTLWQSDGTAAGTGPAIRLPPASHPAGISSLTAVGGFLYLIALNTESQSELWRSDGTAAGLVRTGAFQSIAPALAALGPRVFFAADGALWETGGTLETTSVLADSGLLGGGSPRDLTVSQGLLYFITEVSYRYWTLWRSDGTSAGTFPLRSFALPPAVTTFHLTAAAGTTFFSADDGAHGQELWATDGTAASTRLVRDIAPGLAASSPLELTAAGGLLWLKAADGTHGLELWQSDGTEEGTRLVQGIAPEALSADPLHLAAAGGNLYFSAADGATGRELWALPLAGPDACQPDPSGRPGRLCLQGGRYQVEATWRTAQARGRGTAVPLSADTGTFWFFSPTNTEVIVKILDGQGSNGHAWVFYGALSDVEYTLTVTDTRTGLTRRYFNPQGQLASIGDTHAFGPLGAYSTTAPPSPLALVSERTGKAATAPCQAGPERLCLNNNRFAVEVAWKDFQNRTGKGKTVPLTADTGAFWFFDAANIELVVKALDGRPNNGKFWLFYGALSNVEYTLTVTDTDTGTIRTYKNPSGRFASVADTNAF